MPQAQLERPLTTSPLLREKVIERDYTNGIEQQLGGAPQPAQPTPQPAQEGQTQGQEFNHDFNEPAPGEGPAGFKFDEATGGESTSDITGDESPEMKLPAGSAKEIANFAGNIFKVYVPQLLHYFVKIDMNNIEVHIQSGNLLPSDRDMFLNINQQTEEALRYSDDEIKMFEKAVKRYVESNNIQITPGQELLAAVAILGFSGYMKLRGLIPQIKQVVADTLRQRNPAYIDSMAAKTGTEPEPQEKKETKAEKTSV